MEYLDPFDDEFARRKLCDPRRHGVKQRIATVGGLTEVGFADDSELLLVLSMQGRGIFDCASGQRIFRDDDDDRTGWYGHDNLTAVGIGPLQGQSIRLCGLWGGGLPTFTKEDHWN